MRGKVPASASPRSAREKPRPDRTRRHATHDLHDRVGNRRALARIGKEPDRVAGDAARRAEREATRPLPHLGEAERVLGADLSAIRAAVGPEATAACDAIGAEAFTVGNMAVFDRAPDLATVVHEATHALQQAHAGHTLPARIPLLARDGAEEREAHARASGREARAVKSPLAIAMKPKVGDAAQTPGGTDLLPSPGAATKLAYLPPGTEVTVIEAVGPAYRVTVTSGAHAGKTGIVPGHVIAERPAKPATSGPATPGLDLVLQGGQLGLRWREPPGGIATAPLGAEVMSSEHFGGGTWVYSGHSQDALPIPWHHGNEERGLQAEPLITNRYYSHLGPDVLPKGMPAADISIGGTKTEIAGEDRLTGPDGKRVKTYWEGYDVEGSIWGQYKTMDILDGYRTPGAVESRITSDLEMLLTPRPIGKTGPYRGPGIPRIRYQLSNPFFRFAHLEVRGEPTDQQALEIAAARERGRQSGVDLKVYGPPIQNPPTVIGADTRDPAPAYVPPRGAHSSPSEVIAHQAARGNAVEAIASAGFTVLNRIGSAIQEGDKEVALAAATQEAAAYIAANPETGATIWITWYHFDAPWFSLNQPGPIFGGVQIIYERKSSSAPPAGLYKSLRRSTEKVWMPPAAALAATPQNVTIMKASIGKTMSRIHRMQQVVDKYAGEGTAYQFLAGRNMNHSFTGHEMDTPRWYVSLAKTALAAGNLDEAEANLAKAEAAMDGIQRDFARYD